jgi:hypothetical protein
MKGKRWPIILITILVVSFILGVWLRTKLDASNEDDIKAHPTKTVI